MPSLGLNNPVEKYILSIFCLLFLSACATTSEYALQGAPVPQGSYSSTLEKWTDEAKAYSGVMSTYQVTATLLSTDVIQHQVFNEAVKTHRTVEQYQTLRKAALEATQGSTQVFVALFTDKDENNDLDKSKTLWNIFLDMDGKRIMPSSIKRLFENRTVITDKYPYLNAWSKHYLATFPVPQSTVTAQPVTLTLAGPLGAAHLHFPQ